MGIKAGKSGSRASSLVLRCALGALGGGLLASGSALASGGEDGGVGFVLTDGRVVPDSTYAVRMDIIGCAYTDGTDDQPITLELHLGGQDIEPFGDADSTAGDVNQASLPTTKHVVPTLQDASDELTVTATGWDLGSGTVSHQHNSHADSPMVRVLRNGDPAPDLTGAHGQHDVAYFLMPYLTPDASTVWIYDDQVIYLFELGTSDPNDSAADFQDAVVLVTLGETVEELEEDRVPRNNFAMPMMQTSLVD